MKRHETGVPFIRDINDPTLVLRCLEAMLVVWFDEATKLCEDGDETGFTLGIRLQTRSVLRDLHDRQNRLDGEVMKSVESAPRSATPRTERRSPDEPRRPS
jgi:hypothetical protein